MTKLTLDVSRPPTWRAPLSVVGLLWWLQTSILCASFCLFPTLLLRLLCPCSLVQSLCVWWSGVCQRGGYTMALFVFRVFLGIQVVLHVHGGLDGLQRIGEDHRTLFVIQNHRTTLDWCYAWYPLLVMRRLLGQRFVTLRMIRNLPGFGWCVQFFNFVFLSGRSDTAGDLARIRRGVRGEGTPVAVCLFPEGHDLTKKNIAASDRFAESHNPPLPHYTQVLHPRTAGFAEMLAQAPENVEPMLLDLTIGFEDYAPGEIPNPATVFLLGRSPQKIHILVEPVRLTRSEPADAVCKHLFALKEDRLRRFYGTGASGSADVGALSKAHPDIDTHHMAISECWFGVWCSITMQVTCVIIFHFVGLSGLLSYLGLVAIIFILISYLGGVDEILSKCEVSRNAQREALLG